MTIDDVIDDWPILSNSEFRLKQGNRSYKHVKRKHTI